MKILNRRLPLCEDKKMEFPDRKMLYIRFVILSAVPAVLVAAMTEAVQLGTEYGNLSLGTAAGFFAAGLAILLLTGFCINQCFPVNRKQDFRVMFIVIEMILFVIITMIGIELRLNVLRAVDVISDDYGLYQAADILRSSVRPQPGTALSSFFLTDTEYYAGASLYAELIALFGYNSLALTGAAILFQTITAFCAGAAARIAGGRLSGLIVYALFSCLPQEASLILVPKNDSLYFAVLMAAILLFFLTARLDREKNSAAACFILYFFDGLLFGGSWLIHPLSLPVIVSLFLYLLFLSERSTTEEGAASGAKRKDHSFLKGFLRGLVYLLGAAGSFFALVCLKAQDLQTDTASVLAPYFSRWIREKTYQTGWEAPYPASVQGFYTTSQENQTAALVLLTLCLIALVVSFGVKRKEILPFAALVSGLFCFTEGKYWISTHKLMPVCLFLTGMLAQECYEMFVRIHAAAPVKAADDEEETVPVPVRKLTAQKLPQQAEPPLSQETEEFVFPPLETDMEPEKKEIHFIENPLPVPKKHIPKTLDFDIEISDDDDYDI